MFSHDIFLFQISYFIGILLNELLNLVLKHVIREHRPLRSMLISIVVNVLMYSLGNCNMFSAAPFIS